MDIRLVINDKHDPVIGVGFGFLRQHFRPLIHHGHNAITINDGDELLEARLTNGTNEIILAIKSGRAIRFNESTVRPMGRNAAGVRGVQLDAKKDEVIGMVCILDKEKETILVVSQKGYGKRSDLEDYRVTNRGGKGVRTLNITDKTGFLIAIKTVLDGDDLMIINKTGITIRMPVKDLRIMGRATQGVRLIKLDEDDEIASVAKVEETLAIEEIDTNINNDSIIVIDENHLTDTKDENTTSPENEEPQ